MAAALVIYTLSRPQEFIQLNNLETMLRKQEFNIISETATASFGQALSIIPSGTFYFITHDI